MMNLFLTISDFYRNHVSSVDPLRSHGSVSTKCQRVTNNIPTKVWLETDGLYVINLGELMHTIQSFADTSQLQVWLSKPFYVFDYQKYDTYHLEVQFIFLSFKHCEIHNSAKPLKPIFNSDKFLLVAYNPFKISSVGWYSQIAYWPSFF